MTIHRVDGNACSPLTGAFVDVWHCDAVGAYSDVAANGTVGQRFLRGYQLTDANGLVQFLTVYPGWYQGRTVHIHFKVRLFAGGQQTYEFTSQLYFDDSITDLVYNQVPYNARGARSTRNTTDGIYTGGNSGAELLLALSQEAQGYLGMFDIGLRLT